MSWLYDEITAYRNAKSLLLDRVKDEYKKVLAIVRQLSNPEDRLLTFATDFVNMTLSVYFQEFHPALTVKISANQTSHTLLITIFEGAVGRQTIVSSRVFDFNQLTLPDTFIEFITLINIRFELSGSFSFTVFERNEAERKSPDVKQTLPYRIWAVKN
jgi:hypothetical protein